MTNIKAEDIIVELHDSDKYSVADITEAKRKAINALKEQKEATWVIGKNDKSLRFCNRCGAKVNVYWNYCPNCGAKRVSAIIEIGSLEAGTTIEVGGIRMEILDNAYAGKECKYGVFCLAKDILFYGAFDEMNYSNWEPSSLRKYLNNEYKESLDKELVDALIPFKRNLLTDDGLDDYGTCEDQISLISEREYQDYRKYISNKSDWWRTLTAWSANSDGAKCVRVINANGSINIFFAHRDNIGVSPVFLLRPSLKVNLVADDKC